MQCECKVTGTVVSDICALHMQMIRDASAKVLLGVVAAEREACAQIADDHSTWTRSYGAEAACEMVAAEIRKRGQAANE